MDEMKGATMRARPLLILSGFALGVAAAGAAASPDNPRASVPGDPYRSVTSGIKRYRPVEPLPWGDVNRRVTPPRGSPGKAAEPDGKGASPTPRQHRH
jgi:hypothetical protein